MQGEVPAEPGRKRSSSLHPSTASILLEPLQVHSNPQMPSPLHEAPAHQRLRCLHLAFAVLLALLPAPGVHAETKSVQLLDLLRALKAAPNTQAIATRQGYALNDIQIGAADAKAQPGDQVTALVSLLSFDGSTRPTQWIIRLQLAAKPRADSPQSSTTDLTEYTNTGESITFHSDVSEMDLETLGPIPAAASPDLRLDAKRQRISVNTDFLCLDLARTARIIATIKQPTARGGLSVRSRPFPASEVAAGRDYAAVKKLTPDDVRSFAGSAPAIDQFLNIVRSTPGLQTILFQVLDKPSIIDVFRHGASSALNINFIGGGTSDGRDMFWTDGKSTDFCSLLFNLEVFGKPALSVVLYVAPPMPPLQVSAGVVGIVALSPSRANKVVVVRVLSATPGASPVQPAPSAP